MQVTANHMTFIVPISSSTHCLAENFCKQQNNIRKARQIYLNTLAIFAVEFYLRCLKVETDWKSSLSWDSVAQTLMDVADLKVTGLGFLECRPVWSEAQVVHIPPEVWSNRIGYVAVQLDQSLREATLMGFSKIAPTMTGELRISQLRSLEDLVTLLYQLRQSEPIIMRTNLSQWLENIFEPAWQFPEATLGSGRNNFLALSLRSDSQASATSVKRAKVINLKLQLRTQAVALLVAVAMKDEQEMGILVQVRPVGEENLLPPNIRLALLLESGETLQSVQSRSLDNFIQLVFSGQPGESFSIQVALDDASVTENFSI